MKQRQTQVAEKPKGKRRRLRDHAEKLARAPRDEARVAARADLQHHESSGKYLPGPCEPLSCGVDAACIPNPDNTQHFCLCTANGEPPTEDFKCPRITSPGKYLPGGCEPLSCGAEAACMPSPDNTQHYCLCTTNGEPPTDDFKCPRSTVPLTPKPIHNVIPPRTANTSTDKYIAAPTAQIPNSLLGSDLVPEATAGSEPSTIAGAGAVASAGASAIAVAAAVGGALLVVMVASLIICYMRKRICLVAGKTQPKRPVKEDNDLLLYGAP